MEIDKPFVDYYRETGHRLVSREFGDINSFIQSRQALFLSLGIPPAFLRGKNILEFGPGAGHYSLFNVLLHPSIFTLVDGLNEALEAAQATLIKYKHYADRIEFVESLFLDFTTEIKYDLVIAESCIPHQRDPDELLKYLAGFVNSGGIMFITTVSGCSYLSEILRRLSRDAIMRPDEEVERQVEIMEPLIAGHLRTLNNVGRTAEQWVLDNIVQPLHKVELLNIPDAINAVSGNFTVLGSSPRFSQDWVWYREVGNSQQHINNNAIENYFQTNANLVDYRLDYIRHERELGKILEDKCGELWQRMCVLESNTDTSWLPVENCLEDIYDVVASYSTTTGFALREAIDWLKDGASPKAELRYFPAWWGRGQQHISFIRSSFGRNDFLLMEE